MNECFEWEWENYSTTNMEIVQPRRMNVLDICFFGLKGWHGAHDWTRQDKTRMNGCGWKTPKKINNLLEKQNNVCCFLVDERRIAVFAASMKWQSKIMADIFGESHLRPGYRRRLRLSLSIGSASGVFIGGC